MINFLRKYKSAYLLEKGNKEHKTFSTDAVLILFTYIPFLVIYMSYIDYETKSNVFIYYAFTCSTIFYVPIILKNRILNSHKYLFIKNFSDSIFLYIKVYIGLVLVVTIIVIFDKIMNNISIVIYEMIIAFLLVNNFFNLLIPTLAKGRFNFRVSIVSLALLMSLIPIILYFKENYFLEIAIVTNILTLTVGILLTKNVLRIKNYTK